MNWCEAYCEQARGLVDGGVDLLLVETIFDTLNAKAAFFAIQNFRRIGRGRCPIMASVTFIQAGSNRGVVRANGRSVLEFHFARAAAERGDELRARPERNAAADRRACRRSRRSIQLLSRMPGLPNPLLPTGFPETPETLAPQLRDWADNGWLNIVGGCCGTTPDHIQAIAEAVRGCAAAGALKVEPYTPLERP